MSWSWNYFKAHVALAHGFAKVINKYTLTTDSVFDNIVTVFLILFCLNYKKVSQKKISNKGICQKNFLTSGKRLNRSINLIKKVY